MNLTPDTPVTLTMKQLYLILSGIGGLALAAVLAVWGITTYTVSDIRSNVVEIRKGLTDNIKATNDVNLALTKEISGLRVDVAGLAPKIDNLNATIGKLEFQIAGIQNPWTDPKAAVTFVDNLKRAGVIVTPAPARAKP
jgi:hypothetical protein